MSLEDELLPPLLLLLLLLLLLPVPERPSADTTTDESPNETTP